MIIQGMLGLGDSIYQRAFLKQYREPVYLRTPWPELYRDLPNIRCMHTRTILRTQNKNVERNHEWWMRAGHPNIQVRYGTQPIIPSMQQCFGFAPSKFDLPDFGSVQSDIGYAVVRPVTRRKEWMAKSRNPDPTYVAEAASILHQAGFKVVSVADLEEGEEWAVGELPEADVTYHKGELDTPQLMALIQGASVVVGGVGWIVPAAIAAKVPAWIICGGQGGYNSPEKITSPLMDLSKIEFALPDNFCKCTSPQHTCDKHISDHADKFTGWLRRLVNLVA